MSYTLKFCERGGVEMKVKIISNPFGNVSESPISAWVGKIMEFDLVLDSNDRIHQVFNHKNLPFDLKSIMVPAKYALSVLAEDDNCKDTVICYRQILSQEFMDRGNFNFICIINDIKVTEIID